MVPSVSISIVVVAWATCVLFYGMYLDTAIRFVAASSESSALELEATALLESGWWSTAHTNNPSTRCEWPGIICNAAGSVTTIHLANRLNVDKLNLNFSSFPNLACLNLHKTSLQGSIPLEIGILSKLTYLDLSFNNLTGELPLSLTNLTQLEWFDISFNSITGPIPSSLGLLTNLTHLAMRGNHISGFIPSEIGMLKNLAYLNLANNMLIGQIPSTLCNLANLEFLFLYSNQIDGSIPQKIGNMKSLISVILKNNNLSGQMPSTIGHLTNLSFLTLTNNNLSGQIPSTIGHLTNLKVLDLSQNQINGSITTEIGNMTNLSDLYLDHNNLISHIPTQISKLHLYVLSLSHNFICGEAPVELGTIGLSVLDLSYNNLTGNIPNTYISIKIVNLAYNYLKGPIPYAYGQNHTSDTLIGNKNLCGGFNFPPCLPVPTNNNSIVTKAKKIPANNSSTVTKAKENPANNHSIVTKAKNLPAIAANNKSIVTKVKIFVPIAVFIGFLVLGFLLLSKHVGKKYQYEPRETKNGNLFSIWNYDGHIAYEDMIKATEGFDIKYCIGTGGYGSVYKAELPCGKVVALKKLHGSEAENPTFNMSFRNEIKVLIEIRHRNIIKLHGFCLHKQCTFLVYEYMERGSLFYVLSNDVEAIELDWSKRVNIIKGIAYALSYMHHECIQSIVHRDITSKNILLNNKLEGFVSDFGTAKLLVPDSSNQTLVAGTYGYIAPGELLFSCYN